METRTLPRAALALAAAALGACGGSDYGGDGGGGGTNVGATCTVGNRVDIGDAGGTPSCLRVEPNTVVTIVNGRSTTLEIRSGPHPTHGSCPELDGTPDIPAGGSIEVTMVTLANCAYHDHLTGTQLGVIRVASADAPPDPYGPGTGY
jgi:hypothetical protein